MKKITVSAPGKLMLFGEHAVVYGRPCIVTAVDQRMFVTAEILEGKSLIYIKSASPKIDLKIPYKDLNSKNIPKEGKFVASAIGNFLKKYHPIFKGGLKVTTKSEFSQKLGFGSSSAVTVCTIKALSQLFNQNLSNKQIFDLSYKTVLDIQGKGSGFDVAAATYGRTLYFIKGGKAIKPLKINNLPLIVGYSGIKADTVTLINQVSSTAQKYPKLVDDIYTAMGKLVDQAKAMLIKEDFAALGELMNFNHGYLFALGVSITKLDKMINAAKESGAYGAKLSGAGGGDCMIALAPLPKVKTVKQAIAKSGGQIINIKTNEEGLRVEK